MKISKFKPNCHERYYYINSLGEIIYRICYDVDTDQKLFAMGNCYPDFESAKFAVERHKFLVELQRFANRNSTGSRERRQIGVGIDDGKVYSWRWDYAALSDVTFDNRDAMIAAKEHFNYETLKKYIVGDG